VGSVAGAITHQQSPPLRSLDGGMQGPTHRTAMHTRVALAAVLHRRHSGLWTLPDSKPLKNSCNGARTFRDLVAPWDLQINNAVPGVPLIPPPNPSRTLTHVVSFKLCTFCTTMQTRGAARPRHLPRMLPRVPMRSFP
jgi:hypothetical protein